MIYFYMDGSFTIYNWARVTGFETNHEGYVQSGIAWHSIYVVAHTQNQFIKKCI